MERAFVACVAGGISLASAFVLVAKAVNASGEAVKGLVKREFHPRLRRSRNPSRGFAREGIWRLRRRSPAHESRQLRRLGHLFHGL